MDPKRRIRIKRRDKIIMGHLSQLISMPKRKREGDTEKWRRGKKKNTKEGDTKSI